MVVQKIVVSIFDNNSIIWVKLSVFSRDFWIEFNGCYSVFIAPQFTVSTYSTI